MKVLNLGCGTKTTSSPEVISIDWSIYLWLKKKSFLAPFMPIVFRGERLDRFNSLPNNIMVHNLAKGIPFDDESVDVVYHSHFLEHLDRNNAVDFLIEVKRVLKPGGVHRIVVPDLEIACKDYLDHLTACETDAEECHRHDSYIEVLLEQSVRKEAFGTSQQRPLRRFIENILLGDARRRGETHQWMYDRVNLKELLVSVGYSRVLVQDYDKSQIENWCGFGLDLDESGNQYKPNSLYIEAIN